MHPNFSTHPMDSSIDKGGEVSFSCTYPRNVSISWNGPGVRAGRNTSSVTMDGKTSTLTITNVTGPHTGEYFCTTHDSVVVNSNVATLTVNCKYTYRGFFQCLHNVFGSFV